MQLKTVPVSVAIFIKNQTHASIDVWMQIRSDGGPLHGLLEFPGGKIEPNETPIQAMIREVQEEVELTILENKHEITFFKLFPYDYGTKTIHLNVFYVKYQNEMEEILNQKGKWTTLYFDQQKNSAILELIPKANIVVIEELLLHLIKTI